MTSYSAFRENALNVYSVCESTDICIHKTLSGTLYFIRDLSTKGKILTAVIIYIFLILKVLRVKHVRSLHLRKSNNNHLC